MANQSTSITNNVQYGGDTNAAPASALSQLTPYLIAMAILVAGVVFIFRKPKN